MPHTTARKMMADTTSNIVVNQEILAYTSAKLYYRGGGWWVISGYSHDGDDVNKLITEVVV
jgi:hypothetical protein